MTIDLWRRVQVEWAKIHLDYSQDENHGKGGIHMTQSGEYAE